MKHRDHSLYHDYRYEDGHYPRDYARTDFPYPRDSARDSVRDNARDLERLPRDPRYDTYRR
jgi:hypothetical protein